VDAALFLRRADDPIKPRIRIPAGAFGDTGNTLPIESRCELGRALCVYGESGLGAAVRRGKYQDHRFDDDLLDAAVECITQRWLPSPEPSWVTWVPSRRDAVLVPDFARRIAARLGIPAIEAIEKPKDTLQQKEMQNSVQQARNVGIAFRAKAEEVRQGPVLLIDDIVDSGWTFTAAGAKLRKAGSGPVFPFALARMRSQPD
jgi:ATP-dependent DNA helicase RecQ